MDNRKETRKRNDAASDDVPIYSRLFVVCGKNASEDVLRELFTPYGEIEDFYYPVDFNTGLPKGICFVKFSKTSDAAKALEALHMKSAHKLQRSIRVMVAASRNDIHTEEDADKYKRLFINTPKTITEEELLEHFSQFGKVESVIIQRDRETEQPKGFAYIKYRKFSEAAIAYEECDKKYRAVFAQPKASNRKSGATLEPKIGLLGDPSVVMSPLIPMMNVQPQGYTRVFVNCSPFLTNFHIKQLFDLIPGMIDCRYAVDLVREYGKGSITYSSQVSAAYAVEKLNHFEYPPGCKIFVKPDFGRHNNINHTPNVSNALNNLQSAMSTAHNSGTPDLAKLAEAIAQASQLIKAATTGVTEQHDPGSFNYCSVKLPPPQPLAHIDSPVAKRCFLVCKPEPPSLQVLRDVFCRFGNLINVYTLPNKTVGYARYALAQSADEAIRVLHGSEICGVRVKVLEAEDEDQSAQKRRRTYY
ncbi:RNA-binding protein 45 [Plutella xylostella]|uniref:RNA-binding protein 45 n=1 Tax=Plutella xylostella TaxID=51655 RepID=UPI0020328468|nr:RNA-binding protein 45 [Plutella xylostella]